MNKSSAYFLMLCILVIIGCAKKGTITGGPKDEDPPKFLKAYPPNYTTNFRQKEIKIYFDEYVKLKDPQKQIIVSPPMDPKPIITPLGGASKFIKIQFKDTLKDNTTYSINFGQSIEDNNEGNALASFNYIFSTGASIDSLKISGTIADALSNTPDTFISVGLYEMNEHYTDSIIFKEVPRYVTNTLDSTHFSMTHLRPGTYKLVALKDASSNYTFEPKKDKIGFYEDVVSLPADTSKVFNLKLFKEVLDYKATRPKQVSKHKLIFGYEGEASDMKIKLLTKTTDTFSSRIIKEKNKDTLNYWIKPFIETDSLHFEITNGDTYTEEFKIRFKDQKFDSLKVSTHGKRELLLHKPYQLTANTPIDSIQTELIKVFDKDTTAIPFTTNLDTKSNILALDFEKKEASAYTVEILPAAITDFYRQTNDTLSYSLRTKKLSDYGKMFITLENVKTYPVIVELTDDKNKVIASTISSKEEVITFDFLNPGKYNLRVLFDTNTNGKWDSGHFLKQLQPERVSYYPAPIEVRSNWEIKQTFKLDD